MKKYPHSYNYGRRINWRTLTIAFSIAACFFLAHYGNIDNTYVAEPNVYMSPVVVTPPPTVEDKIRSYFPRSWKTMIAVAHAESGMSMDAKGYNCYYYRGKATTTPIKGGSKACDVVDRPLAYSVDCFVLQRNYKGQQCPEGVTLDQHLKEVSELSKVQGLQAWSAYNNNSYKKHLHEQIQNKPIRN